ncbi:MAG: type pilus assembly protein PilW [Pseudomonadota bacterium]|jgi:type IV pilus assembly protein PilW
MSDSKFNNFYQQPGQRKDHRQRIQAGFSLVELMVSLTIGLVITVAALSAYVGSSNAGRVADAQSRMNEDAQAALSTLSQQVRLAGANPVQVGRVYPFRRNPVYLATYAGGTSITYIPPLPSTVTLPSFSPSTYTLSAFAVRGCDGTFSNITNTAANRLDALTCATTTTTLPDSIAVSYESDQFNTVKVGVLPSDCLGQKLSIAATVTSALTSIPNGSTITVADNRFYIANQPNRSPTVPSLYCKGNGNTQPQPLVENVEDMQLTYGVVSTTDTAEQSTIAGYLTANQVETETSMAALANSGLRWGRVLSVRICVVVRSENPVAPDAASGKYYKCDGTLDSSKTDLRLRRAYSTTVVLRNRRA